MREEKPQPDIGSFGNETATPSSSPGNAFLERALEQEYQETPDKLQFYDLKAILFEEEQLS